MKKILALALMFPALCLAEVSVEAEVSAFSNFIWRGTTFTENKPAVQGVMEVIDSSGFYVGTFVSNAEFSDEAKGPDATVTQETDFSLGKRWNGTTWELQLSYNRFFFPGAGVFDTDEFNVILTYKRWHLELSYMDDYFGYQGVYKYVRLGYAWLYKKSVEGEIYIGYNAFEKPKGSLVSRCLDSGCTETAYTTNGAGNPDYIDLYQVNRKTFKNGMSVELAINVTNRKEYEASGSGISLSAAKDFTIITGILYPFEI